MVVTARSSSLPSLSLCCRCVIVSSMLNVVIARVGSAFTFASSSGADVFPVLVGQVGALLDFNPDV